MDIKKYQHADLESKKSVFFQIGLIVALGLIFSAFEWTTSTLEAPEIIIDDEPIEVLELPPLVREEKKVELPPVPKILETLVLAPDDSDVPEEDIVFTSETDPDEGIYEVPVEEDIPEIDFIVVEDMPEYPGGELAMMKFIANNIKYPVACAEEGIQGRVYLSFVIDKDGNVVDLEVMRSPHPHMAQEALRVMKLMPKWKPGYQRDKAVRVKYNMPVKFSLSR